MGFALWVDDELAWAEGTHEYRPLGAAVIAATGVFTARDFSPRTNPPPRASDSFVGLFASLSQVNHCLLRRRSQANRKRPKPSSKRVLSII